MMYLIPWSRLDGKATDEPSLQSFKSSTPPIYLENLSYKRQS